MSNVYAEKPNVVTVSITDDSGYAQRFVVGKTLGEVIASVDPGTPVVAATMAKEKRHRRTKAEMAVSGNGDGKIWP